MNEIDIDLETFSSVSLKDCGVYRYTESPDFEILLFGYSADGGPVNVVDLASGEEIPAEILEALTDGNVLKWAHNSLFERICLSSYLNRRNGTKGYLDPRSWRCSMIWCYYLGLPGSLEQAGEVLNLSEKKMDEGKALIKYFSVPCAATKANGGRTRNFPEHAPDKWDLFKSYNSRDVSVELSIKEKLKKFPVPQQVWDEWFTDQEINDRGVLLSMDLVDNAIAIDEKSRAESVGRLKAITGLDNPNSPLQMRGWLKEHGIETDSLDKKAVATLLKDADAESREVLLLRQQIAKSSVKKYSAMKNLCCRDGRAHGCFQFYGASRSGRWAGRHIQLQNLPQNHMPDLEQARELVRMGRYDALALLYDSIPSVLSELIRTAFVPPEGMKFIVSDFAQIEARVLAYLAHEGWRNKLFLDPGADLYSASASNMFGVPVEKHGRNKELRQKGKIAELALGYGGSVGALTAMGALDMGLAEADLQPLVDMWRASNPNIVSFWWEVDRCVKKAVMERENTRVGNIRFSYKSGMLFIRLPGGRSLVYVKPHMGINRYGSESVMYYGLDSTKHWSEVESYGPKFVENIVQAMSRDILCYAMRNLKDIRIVAHVHDELIIEAPEDASLSEVCEVMGQTPPWAKGLCLRADGFESSFYKKD